MKFTSALLLVISLCLAVCPARAASDNTLTAAEKAAGWQLLFNGSNLDGWKASDKPGTFFVEKGILVVFGPRSHLYYQGPIANHSFRNFELSVDIMTFPRANSGVYFHTEYQDTGWPNKGYEVQVNNSHKDPKRGAGLYGIKDNMTAPAKDGEWYTMRIKVVGKNVETYVNDKLIVSYVEEPNPERPDNFKGRLIGSGTFAIQGHDPESRIHFRNIKVRVLP